MCILHLALMTRHTDKRAALDTAADRRPTNQVSAEGLYDVRLFEVENVCTTANEVTETLVFTHL